MADTLQQWINDASAYELLNTYRIEQQELYPFVNNGEDFYISLLNRMFFTMRNKEMKPEVKNGILLQIVKGLQVYSEETTADIFNGVNRNNNLLYIAAIYYLCEYNALSQLFMWRAQKYEFENESAQLLYSIMAGSEKYAKIGSKLCQLLKEFFKLDPFCVILQHTEILHFYTCKIFPAVYKKITFDRGFIKGECTFFKKNQLYSCKRVKGIKLLL